MAHSDSEILIINVLARQNFKPLRKSSPHRRKVERFLDGKVQAVPMSHPTKSEGWCYWNVQQEVEAVAGSEMVFGWLVSVWPNRIIECLHHAVYKEPLGNLFDATRYPYGEYETVSFVASDEIRPKLSWPPYVRSRFISLSRHESVKIYKQVHHRQNEILREMIKRTREIGGQFEPFRGVVYPGGTSDPEILKLHQEFEATKHEYDRSLVRLAEM